MELVPPQYTVPQYTAQKMYQLGDPSLFEEILYISVKGTLKIPSSLSFIYI